MVTVSSQKRHSHLAALTVALLRVLILLVSHQSPLPQQDSRGTGNSSLHKRFYSWSGNEEKKSARRRERDYTCPGRRPCEQYGNGWNHGSCCGAIGERGQSSPHLLCSNACLISLGEDRGSFSMAHSNECPFSCYASNQAHGLPDPSKCSSQACHASLPTTGNSLAFLASGCASSNSCIPIRNAAPFLDGRPGIGRGRIVPISRLCFT